MDVEGVREEARTNLAQTLLSESEAYGYTLTIWGSTAMLIREFDTPAPIQVFAFVAGALVAFAALASIAFDDLFAEPDPPTGQETKLVVSMIHFLASFGNLFVVRFIIVALRDFVPLLGMFLFIGFQATLVYNALLLVEHVIPPRFRQ